MAEGDADTDDGLRVGVRHHVHDRVALLVAQQFSVRGWGTVGRVRDRWAGHQDRVDRAENAAFAEGTDDPCNVAGG